jgi:very-short-patch-repair endonuclease/predicted transcriptional regulator
MRKWTPDEIYYFKQNFAFISDKELSKHLMRGLGGISYMAFKLNLKKDQDYIEKIKKKSAVEFRKDKLEEMYFNKKLSMRKIAKILGVGKTTIEYYFDKYKIIRRNHSDSTKIRFLTENVWSKGLSKKNNDKIRKLAKKVSESYKKKREEKIDFLEKKYGKDFRSIIYDLYWKERFTQEKISKELKIDRGRIIKMMRDFKINLRPNYEYIASLKGENHPLFGITWDKLLGKEKSDKRKSVYGARFRELTIKRIQNNEFPFFDTAIEKIMAKELVSLGIPFVKQFNIDNKFVCDFAIPILKIIIECDGDYWHANPKMYSKDNLTYDQKKKIQRDISKDKCLEENGWLVLRFFESDINEDLNKCIFKIKETIKKRMEELKKIKSPIEEVMK